MDAAPIAGISELQTHLQKVADDPSLPFEVKLLDDVELQLTEDNIPPLLPTFLPLLSGILKATTQDPAPLLSLTIKLLSPLSFTQTLAIADPPSLLMALSSPLSGANLLALAIVEKAAVSPSDVSILSTFPEVVEAMVKCWIATEDVGVGERAARVLGALLATDCEIVDNGIDEPSPRVSLNGNQVVKRRMAGHGRLWKFIFSNRSNLSLIQQHCSFDTTEEAPGRTIREVTISQGRLLRLLPRLCTMNIAVLARSFSSDLFVLPAADGGELGQGLLQWTALGMVDKADALMHLNLVDFFETLVSVMRVSGRSLTVDTFMGKLVKAAIQSDYQLETALKTLPDRTVEEEAEPLRTYITGLLA
ncbi:hypothetical protein E4U42_004840 [Claviceps africana]|uniref:DNA mismatch repair protein HSM3 N-terminal domain-containing protein n=1 Tax=Claviceps africana TaxID=83212 RepID=A0A8K0J5L3_9HYPO|nr:hypothetical protein E4U42_004840 [Claviceps africana]